MAPKRTDGRTDGPRTDGRSVEWEVGGRAEGPRCGGVKMLILSVLTNGRASFNLWRGTRFSTDGLSLMGKNNCQSSECW